MQALVASVLPTRKGWWMRGNRLIVDTLLACLGCALITGLIAIFQLYPRIPNISTIYLLVVLALAATRGRYAAILAALLAFLAFDFFFVPPLHVLFIENASSWIALFIFLVTALLTGQMAAAIRARAQEAARRENETHLLYDLVSETNRETAPERQFQAIAQAILEILSSWGVSDCALLQEDAAHEIRVQTRAPQNIEESELTPEELKAARWVILHKRATSLYENAPSASAVSARNLRQVV